MNINLSYEELKLIRNWLNFGLNDISDDDLELIKKFHNLSPYLFSMELILTISKSTDSIFP